MKRAKIDQAPSGVLAFARRKRNFRYDPRRGRAFMECCFLQLAETKGPTISPGATDEALTSGEVPVVRRIAEGNGSKQIADWLPITEGTVKGRVKNILSKLGANDRTYAAMIGPKRGIIEFRFTRKSVNATLFGLPSAP